MKGVRFYQEYRDVAKTVPMETGIAILVHGGRCLSDGAYEVAGYVSTTRTSGVCGTSASEEYVRLFCKRISEAKAHELYPELFSWLRLPSA